MKVSIVHVRVWVVGKGWIGDEWVRGGWECKGEIHVRVCGLLVNM